MKIGDRVVLKNYSDTNSFAEWANVIAFTKSLRRSLSTVIPPDCTSVEFYVVDATDLHVKLEVVINAPNAIRIVDKLFIGMNTFNKNFVINNKILNIKIRGSIDFMKEML